MRPKELFELLKVTIKAGLPVLIKGAPGVGKTDVGKQATEAVGAGLYIFHPAVSDPCDYKGQPAVVKGKDGKMTAEFLPYGDLRALIEVTRPTVAFIDDLGQAPAVVQAAAMQLILGRRVNGHRISDEVVFIAATNRREDRAGVTGILEPVKSRFATIVELEVHVDDWCAWALRNNVPSELIAFIRFRPQLLMTGFATNDIVNHPCPRTVTFAGKLFSAGLRSHEALKGAVGDGFASEFLGFVKVWESLPSLDGILLDPIAASVPTEPAAVFAVAVGLARLTTSQNAARVVKYAQRLPEEFGVLCVRDALRVCPQTSNNREFIEWATDHQEALL